MRIKDSLQQQHHFNANMVRNKCYRCSKWFTVTMSKNKLDIQFPQGDWKAIFVTSYLFPCTAHRALSETDFPLEGNNLLPMGADIFLPFSERRQKFDSCYSLTLNIAVFGCNICISIVLIYC